MVISGAPNIGSQIERAAIAYFYGGWPVVTNSQTLVPVAGIKYVGSPIPTATVDVVAGTTYLITPGANENGIILVNGNQTVVLATGTPVTITAQDATIEFEYPNLIPVDTHYSAGDQYVPYVQANTEYNLVWGENELSYNNTGGMPAIINNPGFGLVSVFTTGNIPNTSLFGTLQNIAVTAQIYLTENNVALTAVIYSQSSQTNAKRPNFYFSNDWKQRAAPCITVMAHKGVEDVKFSRDLTYMTTISAKWPGTNIPGEQNLDYNWFQINQLIGVPEAALEVRGPVPDRQDYQLAAWRMSAAGRRLAVFGLASVQPGATALPATDLANNADMATFICDFIEFNNALRMGKDPETDSLMLAEERTFSIHAYNNNDDSIFPALTFDGNHTLNWTFTPGGIAADEPEFWMVEKSVDGNTWIMQEVLDAGARTADITGTGTQYWRVCRSDDGATELDPESNVVPATAQ